MIGVVDVWISLFPSIFFLLQFGRTEVIDNTLNPDFVRKYILDYFFEEKQNLRFDLWVLFFEIKNEWMNYVFSFLFNPLPSVNPGIKQRMYQPAKVDRWTF